MRRSWHASLSILFALWQLPALGAEAPWQTLGHSRYNLLFLPVYDVVLQVPSGNFHFPQSAPYTMDFEWKRDVDAEDILEIVRKQWKLQKLQWPAQWMERLQRVIPDVEKGDHLRVEVHSNHTATVSRNGKPMASIEDRDLVLAFAGIWLSERTGYPAMRKQLLGTH